MIMMFPRPSGVISTPIHARGIVHQNANPYGPVRKNLAEQVDQFAVVWHVLRDIRMRPIGAPENARRIDSDQCLSERNGIAERSLAHGDPLGAADFDPGQWIVSIQIEQRPERPL